MQRCRLRSRRLPSRTLDQTGRNQAVGHHPNTKAHPKWAHGRLPSSPPPRESTYLDPCPIVVSDWCNFKEKLWPSSFSRVLTEMSGAAIGRPKADARRPTHGVRSDRLRQSRGGLRGAATGKPGHAAAGAPSGSPPRHSAHRGPSQCIHRDTADRKTKRPAALPGLWRARPH